MFKVHVQSNLDTTYLGITYFLLLHTFLPSPVFSPSLSLLIYPQYNVHFTTYNLLQRSFSGRPKFVFSYMFQPRYNVNLKRGKCWSIKPMIHKPKCKMSKSFFWIDLCFLRLNDNCYLFIFSLFLLYRRWHG